MKPILLIAWREYKQYVFSRGFLLFLIMFPLGIALVSGTIALLEQTKPTRYYVVFDGTGKYDGNIEAEIDRGYMRRLISAWDTYVEINVDGDSVDAGKIAAPFAPEIIDNERIEAFRNAGGITKGNEIVAPHLILDKVPFIFERARFERVALPSDFGAATTRDQAEAALRPYLLGERTLIDEDGQGVELFAAILIPSGFGRDEASPEAEYWSRNLTDPTLQVTVKSALNSALRRELFEELGLPRATLDDVRSVRASVSSFRPDKAADDAELDTGDIIETTAPAALTYMLVIIIFSSGNLLLTNTIEERSNKIVEILLSSVSANQLMFGKLIGIAAVGLTMPAILLVGSLALGVAAEPYLDGLNITGDVFTILFSTNLLLVYLFYFLCAYLIFAMIFLAIGSVSNSLQDAQSYMGPVMLFVFAPMPFMIMMFQNPNGLIASILTWIPIYTPFAVMMRASADPPMGEIIGATILMLVAAGTLVFFLGRIFRQAILQASPPKMKDIWRLARDTQA